MAQDRSQNIVIQERLESKVNKHTERENEGGANADFNLNTKYLFGS